MRAVTNHHLVRIFARLLTMPDLSEGALPEPFEECEGGPLDLPLVLGLPAKIPLLRAGPSAWVLQKTRQSVVVTCNVHPVSFAYASDACLCKYKPKTFNKLLDKKKVQYSTDVN